MTEWHGYPQHEDAHPERPWWRLREGRATDAWVRSDGLEVIKEDYILVGDQWEIGWRCGSKRWSDYGRPPIESILAEIDREHPLPAPEPRCGQVWVHSEYGDIMVSATSPSRSTWGGMVAGGVLGAPLDWWQAWPPPSAVLVAGPGAPWMNTAKKEE